jgi:sortase A
MRLRALLKVFGELSMTAGAVLLLFCCYLLWGTGAYTDRQQEVLQEQVLLQPEPKKLGKIKLGRAVALIRIPKLGDEYKYAIVEGVDSAHLREGPGHYPGTAMPGDVGNFVLSGHRTTYSAPFNRIDELKRGDDIVIDTRKARYTYRVVAKQVVLPTRMDVIEPVPQRPDVTPTRAMITLTTCHPEYSARQRLVVFGELSSREERIT